MSSDSYYITVDLRLVKYIYIIIPVGNDYIAFKSNVYINIIVYKLQLYI